MRTPDLERDVAEVLFTREQIAEKVSELAARLSAEYAGRSLTLVSVLKGSLPFMADLMRAITIPVHMAGAVDTRGVQFWFMATRALIAMIPPVLLALLAQRYIVRGLTLGAVKG